MSVMTDMPSDSHWAVNVSMSMIFVSARYKTGFTLFCSATDFAAKTGDGLDLPVANQFSLSHTQKSESSCTAIACVFVTIISSIIVYSVFVLFRCSITSDVFVSGVSPKLKSVNVGTVLSFCSVSVSNDMSKSDGNGNMSSDAVSVSDSDSGDDKFI